MKNMIYSDALEDTDEKLPENLIRFTFSDTLIRALMIHCLRVDIPDNNDKADMIKIMLGDEFRELGTGTNRIALLKDGMVYKIALDRRGLIDNFTEFKRSSELPMYLAKTYETNLLINVCEYVEVIDQRTFMEAETEIKSILEDMAKAYLFNDVGYTMKNYCNWGLRYVGAAKELVILDYGYLYPLIGQNRDQLFRCPRCGGRLAWNASYTAFVCQAKDNRCQAILSPTDIRRMMHLNFESAENNLIAEISGDGMPDLNTVEQALKESVEV